MVDIQPTLQIDPPVGLIFRGDNSVSQLRLTNPTTKIICFKVKTTAPRNYSVRPNAGMISPGDAEVIFVTRMTTNRQDRASTDPSKHKFLVQSTYAPSCEVSLMDLWKQTPQSEIAQTRFHVVVEDEPVKNESLITSTSDHLNSTPYGQVRLSELEEISHIASGEQAGENSSGIKEGLADIGMRRNVDNHANIVKVNLEWENKILKERLAQLDSHGQQLEMNKMENGMAILQVALIALAAVLIGLILGKIF